MVGILLLVLVYCYAVISFVFFRNLDMQTAVDGSV